MSFRFPTSLALLLFACSAQATEASCSETTDNAHECLPVVQVLGRRENLIGESISASQGLIGPTELDGRPRLRSGDLLEFVPGLVATQHSGSGKANQYFLRGFNLDHGTDFATFVDGMPVNLRSHGHGQGYSDLNFLIPELVEELEYRKGPYFADVGDFSSAGSAFFRLAESLPVSTVELGVGDFGFRRGVYAGGGSLGPAELVVGAEMQRYDGPWTDIDEDVRKQNLVLRGSVPLSGGTAHLTAMAYDNTWNSPDQVPQRAIDSGLIDRFGSLDRSLGGESSRYSLSGGWTGSMGSGTVTATAYAIDYDLSLFSNFTYFLDHPATGDQFRQFDQRRIYGFDASDAWQGERWQLRVGLSGRRDDIDRVGLSHTQARRTLDPIRDDAVDETSLGVFVDGEYQFNERLRAYLGLRYDSYDFDVKALQPANSGRANDDRASPKASLAWTATDALELYASYGAGFHSNDARGATIRVDPLSGAAVERVDPLVASRGSELGARLFLSDRVNATVSLWQLDLDSELVFVGDAGNTEASRPSRRRGLELGVYWLGDAGWRAELEAAFSTARFDDSDPVGHEVPGSVPRVISAGLSHEGPSGWFGALRLRHVGAYPLVEDDSVRSDASTLVNLRLGRRWGAWTATLDVLNALDSDDHDIDYYYASRLPGERDGQDDLHFHGFEPRALRFGLRYAFD